MLDIYRCIPFRYINSEGNGKSDSGKIVQVLMISSSSGPGLLFPKVQPNAVSSFAFRSFGNEVTYFIHIGRMGE